MEERDYSKKIYKENDEILNSPINIKKKYRHSYNAFNVFRIRGLNPTRRFARQEVVSIYSCKGGIGRTSIAVNLCHLAGDLNPLLIDLNFAEGSSDTSIILQLPKIPHLGKFISELGNSERALSDTIVKSDVSGLSVIQPPPTLKQSDLFKIDHLAALLDEAKRKFGLIVFDLPCRYDDLTLMGLRMSSCVLLVTTCDFGSMFRLRELVSMLDPDQRKILVINTLPQYLQLKPKDITRYLNIRETVIINYDSNCIKYLNKSRLSPSGTIFSDGIEKLLNTIFGDIVESDYYAGGQLNE